LFTPRTGSHLFTYRLLKFLCNFLYETLLAQIYETFLFTKKQWEGIYVQNNGHFA